MWAGLMRAIAALKHRNFRIFWTGQLISLIGTWMQNLAQGWLVLTLTDPYSDYFINNDSRRSILNHEEITDPFLKMTNRGCPV